MVLESLINPRKAEGKPWETFFIGIIYSSVAIFLSLWIFKDYASLVMVFLTVTASVPLMYNIILFEEEKDKEIQDEKVLGTIHIALGNNVSMGGNVNVPLHLDGVIKKPTVYLDGKLLMKDGKLLVI